MKTCYRRWLERQTTNTRVIADQMARVGRVEAHYGDVDDRYAQDRMAGLMETLSYSVDDERHNRPNTTSISIDGNIRNGLASLRAAIKKYKTFRDADGYAIGTPESVELQTDRTVMVDEEVGQRIGLERDMQAALRINIKELEPGLVITDDGAERSVDSGFIDITARDTSGTTVVIELKAGTVGRQAIGQILSYMGDVISEEESGNVRGILVASDFDAKAKAAAKMVPNLILRKYGIRFMFSDGHS